MGAKTSAHHGAVTYYKTTLGRVHRINSEQANIVELHFTDLGISTINLYIAPMY